MLICPIGIEVLGKQRAGPQIERLSQGGDFAAAAGGGGGLLELINVHGEVTDRAELYHILVECDRRCAQHVPDGDHDLIQVVGCSLQFGIRPEPLGHHIAVQPVPRS